MNKLEQVDEFAAFAKMRLERDSSAGIDDLYDQWRQTAFADLDAKAVVASVKDVERGERGIPTEPCIPNLMARF
jgi:hypothetical protein